MSQFSPVPRRVGLSRADRALVRRVDGVRDDAVVGAARIKGASALAELGLLETGRLAMQESRLRLFAPAAEHRFAAICEAFTAKASSEVLGLSSSEGLF
ncbi:MAG: hypothetical protein ACTHOE_04915 [Conexibacter sp.]